MQIILLIAYETFVFSVSLFEFRRGFIAHFDLFLRRMNIHFSAALLSFL
jgi:hypothetical protein